jgi:hypothetical protein
MIKGFPFALSYSNGEIVCGRARSLGIFIFTFCSIFGPGMIAMFYFNDRASFSTLALLPKAMAVFFNLFAWYGMAFAIFYKERIIFDCVERRIRFFRNSRVVRSIEPSEIGTFEIREESRVRRDAGSWTAYVVYLKSPDGTTMRIVETTVRDRAQELMDLLRVHFLREL